MDALIRLNSNCNKERNKAVDGSNMFTEQDGQEFFEGDVLDLGTDDTPPFLVQSFIIPSRIDSCQFLNDSIVFPDPNGVHGR